MARGRDADFAVTEAMGHGDFLKRTREKLPFQKPSSNKQEISHFEMRSS